MKRRYCVAFVHSEAHDELWTPCGSLAAPSRKLCSKHQEAASGLLLGLMSLGRLTEEALAMRQWVETFWQGKN